MRNASKNSVEQCLLSFTDSATEISSSQEFNNDHISCVFTANGLTRSTNTRRGVRVFYMLAHLNMLHCKVF